MRFLIEKPSICKTWEEGVDALASAVVGSYRDVRVLGHEASLERGTGELVDTLRREFAHEDDEEELSVREVVLQAGAILAMISATTDEPDLSVWCPHRLTIDTGDEWCGRRWAEAQALLLSMLKQVGGSYGAVFGCGPRALGDGSDLVGRPKVGWVTALSTQEYGAVSMDTVAGVVVENGDSFQSIVVESPWDWTNVRSVERLRAAERLVGEQMLIPRSLIERMRELGVDVVEEGA